jgi:hypothetical protein
MSVEILKRCHCLLSLLSFYVNSVLRLLHHMVVDDFADVSEAEYTSETLASTTSTSRCNNPRAESPSIINHRESLIADIY